MRYRAFISYSHADAATAGWLHRKLEAWRVPARMRRDDPALPEKLAPVFRDREELGSAGELGPQIQGALAESEALIVLCSPEAARSRWVDQEVRAFRATGRGERVFALIVAGEPGSGDARECFPPALRESEPLAADLRPGKDGKELALLKLIAGLIGVPLDTLRQREARRRHQRMLAVTSLALVVMLVTSVLAVQASIAREAAERRQKQAEALVGFMLGDLNDKLSEVSRLDILEGVHDQAMDYFRSLPDTDLTDEALAQRALALTKIGNVRMEQGKLPKALEAYQTAEPLAARLARRAPSHVGHQLAHAEVLAYVGMVQWYQGHLDEAMAAFDAAQEPLLRARALAPGNAELQFQLSTLDNNAGHVLEARGDFAAASAHYRRMLAMARQLVARDAGNIEWQNQLGLAHNNLAKMALLQGDLAGAIAGYRADVAIEAMLAGRDPRNNAQAERLVLAQGALGRTLALAGQVEDAARALESAVASAERLHALEPDSASFLENIPIYATALARLRRLQDRRLEAVSLAARAQATAESLLARNAEHPSWLRHRAEAKVEQALQALAAGQAPAARTALAAALSALEPQQQANPQDRGALLAAGAAHLAMASIEDSDAARARARRLLAACDAQANGTADPRLLALRAEALLRAGERARAAALAGRLQQLGYREPAFVALLHQHAIDGADPAARVAAGR